MDEEMKMRIDDFDHRHHHKHHHHHEDSTRFQDEYDEYVSAVSDLMNDVTKHIPSEARVLLEKSIKMLDKYRHCIWDLDIFEMKFTPKKPSNLQYSDLKKCLIGKCDCGMLLVQTNHLHCPKCKQFVDWSYKEEDLN